METSDQQPAPRIARWDLYPKCNLNCIHCCAKDLYNYIDSDFLKLDKAILLLDKLKDIGITQLNILGKESFLHPHIFEILAHACKLGMIVDITTNGTCIQKEDIPLLVDLGLRSIFFSFDGSTPEIHDRIRGQGVFEKASKTMEDVVKEKERKRSTLMVNVNTVLNKINSGDILNLVDFCSERGGSQFKLSHLLTTGRAITNLDDLLLDPTDEFEITEEVVKTIPKYPNLAFDVLSDHPVILEYFYRKYKMPFSVEVSGCKGCRKEIYVDPVGGISPCLGTSLGFSHFSHGKSYRIDLFDLNDQPIVETPIYAEFQSTFPLVKETYKDYDPCYSCVYLTTFCYPCPIGSLNHTRQVEDWCVITLKKIDELNGGEKEYGNRDPFIS
ncbi:MAG: radical SAM protein [Candidatus Omnitrophota bacterium]